MVLKFVNVPPTKIRPSGCTTNASTSSFAPAAGTSKNVVSSEPSTLKRAR